MKKKILVLGTGFAAFRFLKDIDTDVYDVTVVSPRNHFLFTPLLPSTTVGTLEFRSIIEPIRNLKGIKYWMAECLFIDTANNSIHCLDKDSGKEFEHNYDILVMGVGEITNTFGIEGVKEHAYFLRELADARRIRINVIDCFENASLPGLSEQEKRDYLRFVVCGGGPTGVEFAAELHDFIEDDVKKNYPHLRELVEIVLVEASGTILGSFTKKLSEYTMKIFKRQNIKLMTNSLVTRVDDDNIYLKDGSKIRYTMLVWATGNAPTSFIQSSDIAKTDRGKIIVNEHFKLKGTDNVYAIGDCAEMESRKMAATAQVAQQQGLYVAKRLNRISKGKEPKPFNYKSLGMMAYIGGHKALVESPQFSATGFKTWILWRSAYLTKLISLKNKMLVLFDWFTTFLFGRDISKF